ncbi:translocation protein Sec62-domain-containing protein [Auriculariales sp. MPI-PUGE-AT-0066]|nr:translocation protein Sec62-domain-containing protein [Auriculariales sp. MPI-PUGE-AT-0066]
MPELRIVRGDSIPLPEDLAAVADYLRHGTYGLKLREGVLNERRKIYFKGRSALNALLHPSFAKLNLDSIQSVTNEPSTIEILTRLMDHGVFLAIEEDRSSHTFRLPSTPPTSFSGLSGTRYVWIWTSPSRMWQVYTGSGILLASAVFLALFPLWPSNIQRFVSLLPIALVVWIITAAGLRWVIFQCTSRSFGQAVVLFPRLYDDVDILRTFWPLWAWHDPAKEARKKQAMRRKKKKHSAQAWARAAIPNEMRFEFNAGDGGTPPANSTGPTLRGWCSLAVPTSN